jgi:predicted amidohydrolase YtcJ
MTLDAAFASFTESTQGSLVPGKCADLVVLSRDIMSVPQEDILKAEVRATIVDGRLVYGSLDL